MKKNSIEEVNIENEQEYLHWCNNLSVHLIGSQYNSLIDAHNREIERRQRHKKEKYKDHMSFDLQYKLKYSRYQSDKPVLNINVSDKQKVRAYTFFDYFMETIQAFGGSVSVDTRDYDNTVITLPHCRFECSLAETKCKYGDIKPTEIKTMKPVYEAVDSGKLEFKIYAVNENKVKHNESIYDEENVELRNQISKIFINLRNIYIEISQKNIDAKRIRDEEYKEFSRERDIKWQKEKEESERKKQDEQRIKQQGIIEKHIEKWEYLKEVGAYVTDIRLYSEKQPENMKALMSVYCEYVENLFDRDAFMTDIVEFVEDNIQVK